MAFGLKAKIEVPKIEVPKIEVPKVDLAAAVGGAVAAATNTVASVVQSVETAASSAVGAVTETVGSAVAAVSLSSVAGAIADVDVSFKGGTADFAMEPHMVLDANASYGETKFEKGPIWIMVDLTMEEARKSTDCIRLFSKSGAYDQKYLIRESCIDANMLFGDGKNDASEMVAVRFSDAPMSDKYRYSLEVIPGQGASHVVFHDVSYGDLRCDAIKRSDSD